MKLVSVAEMQAIEKAADAQGWSYAQMMERAGQGLAEMVQSFYGYGEERSVLGLVGTGNNGGDTLIALAALAKDGWRARAYLIRPRPGDSLVQRLRDAGGEAVVADDDHGFHRLDDWLAASAVLLDGILGTGFKLPMKGNAAKVLAHVKASAESAEFSEFPSVVAVDCPSGIDLDTGEAAEHVLSADLTVCMAAVKTGLLHFPAFGLAGTLEVVDIGLPETLKEWQAIRSEMVTDETVRPLMPARPQNSHKGTFGTVCVLAGSLNYTGAALLCASAALRIGAGLVQIAAPAPLHAALAGQIPEATWVLLPHELGVVSRGAVEDLLKQLGRANVLLMGPGFGQEETTAAFVRRLVESSGTKGRIRGIGFVSASDLADTSGAKPLPPMVVDADGLKLLARVPVWYKKLPEGSVLTPHPGEMAILTGTTIEEVQVDRLGLARRCAALWGHVVVLKGAMTIVASPDGRARVIPVATSALAHGGTGDVLAGMIAGLRAQGAGPFDAATAAAWLHAQTGLLAAEQIGHEASVLAGDLIDVLPEVLSWVW